jgi:hypothetical protein
MRLSFIKIFTSLILDPCILPPHNGSIQQAEMITMPKSQALQVTTESTEAETGRREAQNVYKSACGIHSGADGLLVLELQK